MKTRMKIITLALIFCIGAGMTPQKASAQGGSVNFQVFYDQLSPYGTWVDNPQYGYVWVPDVAPGFTPYSTNGYWVFTDQGWTWVSNYSWGWAPFHYGRWYTDPYYGPIWVPDNEWGPGWVTWRRSGDYYGWAPIGPGVSISMAYSNGYDVPFDRWTFVRNRDFGRRDINNYYVDHSTNVTIINNSTVINNTRVDRSHNVTYNAGPDRAEVVKVSGRQVTAIPIQATSKPGEKLNNNQLQIYKPSVVKNVSSGQKPAPVKVADMKDVKPPAQRSPAPAQKNIQQGKPDQKPPAKQQPPNEKQVQPANKQQPPQQQKTMPPAKQQQAPPAKQQQAPPAKQQPPKQQPQQQQQKPQQQQPPKQQPQQQQQKPQQQQPPKQQPQQQQQKQQQQQPPKQQPQQQQQKQQQPQPPKQQPQQQQQKQQQPPKQQPQQQQQKQPQEPQHAQPPKQQQAQKPDQQKAQPQHPGEPIKQSTPAPKADKENQTKQEKPL
ncbi:MAG: hypothetical protein NTW10_11050 [Bacteroidetes bacterium]|nr:hypothetical protein [Bacteroidota bacterium]